MVGFAAITAITGFEVRWHSISGLGFAAVEGLGCEDPKP